MPTRQLAAQRLGFRHGEDGGMLRGAGFDAQRDQPGKQGFLSFHELRRGKGQGWRSAAIGRAGNLRNLPKPACNPREAW